MDKSVCWSFTCTLHFSKIRQQIVLGWLCCAIKLQKMQIGRYLTQMTNGMKRKRKNHKA